MLKKRRLKHEEPEDEGNIMTKVDEESEIKQEEKHDAQIMKTETKEAKQKYPAFDGDTNNLPPPTADKRGGPGKPGEARYYLRPTKNGYDLIKIYNTVRGVNRRLAKTYKTVLETKTNKQNRVHVSSMRKSGMEVYSY